MSLPEHVEQSSAAGRSGSAPRPIVPPAEDVSGLSKPHNRTQPPQAAENGTLRFYPGASLIELKAPPRPKTERERKPVKRGRVKEWSPQSRMRLRNLTAKLRRDRLSDALVATLTYPASFPAPEQQEVYKRHLHAFKAALRRYHPESSGIWKLEFQARGAAHYHLMIFGLRRELLDEHRSWIRETWYRIAHGDDEHRGSAATQLDVVRSAGGAMNYFVKYITKGDQTRPGDFTGRYWGVFNRMALPLAEPEEIKVPPKPAAMIHRIARRKMKKDVEATRWKRFLNEGPWNRWMDGTRFEWERLSMVKHSGATGLEWLQWIKAEWFDPDEAALIRDGWARVHSSVKRLNIHQLPRRYRARGNRSIRLICNSSGFVSSIGALTSPRSSFLLFSKQCSTRAESCPH